MATAIMPTTVAVNDREVLERLSPTAISGFLRLADLWKLTTDERQDLLGVSVGRTTLAKWARGETSTLSADQLMRISYLLAIYEGLQRIWRRAPHLGDQWPRRRRYEAPFGGHSPVETLRRGGIPAFAAVRAYVDELTGGPPSREGYTQPHAAVAPTDVPPGRPGDRA
jgi:hypothetical protein